MPAGTYHCIIDAIVITRADVTFDLIWRQGTTDTVLGTWTDAFTPTPGSFDAQPYEHDVDAPAILYSSGDQLVFRYTANTSSQSNAWIPNGDGATLNGRDPSFLLPQ